MSALTLAPVSEKAAELLHALYAEALAQVETTIAPAPGTVLLPPVGKLRPSSASDASYMSAYGADFRGSVTLIQNHGRQGQAKWSGDEVRYDTEGRRWERFIRAVINDFGDLVEVTR